MSLARFALAAGAWAAVGCAPLPTIDIGVCGNAVIDAGEDCDTFDRYGSSCRPPGESGACHLDCSRDEDGTRAPCPAGWGCNEDATCRRPTADFEAPIASESGNGLSLISGDFDGDGRSDLIGQEPLDAAQQTRLRFHYFDDRGRVSDTRAFPKVMTAPMVADISRDGRSDVLFSDRRLALLLGASDRSFVPDPFSSYRVARSGIRMFPLYTSEGSPVLAMSALEGVTGFFVPDESADSLRRVLTLPKGIEWLAGDPVPGNVIEGEQASPCIDLVFAFDGETSFSLVDFCSRAAAGAPLTFRETAIEKRIALDPPAPIHTAPILADIDGDGHLDALVGADGKAYFARGDGSTLATATPYRWWRTTIYPATPTESRRVDVTSETIEMPLAAADLSADGAIDFVFPDKLMVSVPGSGLDAPQYRMDNEQFGEPWTEVRIGDLNRDGKLDVVAASKGRLDLDYFNGTNSEHLPHVSITTKDPVHHLTLGDFDGDGVDDAAFTEFANVDEDTYLLHIAFGNLAGGPSAPKRIASLSGVEQIETLRTPSICNLMVSSLEHNGSDSTGVLTFFDGNADRIPLAGYELTNFASTGSLGAREIVGISTGSLINGTSRDALVLATPVLSEPPTKPLEWEFWLMRSLDGTARQAQSLPTQLDATLRPGMYQSNRVRINLASGAADLDGDGVDEALFAMPTTDELRCGLVTVGARDDNFRAPRLTFLDEPCLEPRLGTVDANGDGAADVLLIVGPTETSERRLLVLWNDGAGNFESQRVDVVSGSKDTPRAFTVLPASLVRPLSIAYVTDDAVKTMSLKVQDAGFTPPLKVAAARTGSGIASGDFDGDGVLDLALAEAGAISVLRARLDVP